MDRAIPFFARLCVLTFSVISGSAALAAGPLNFSSVAAKSDSYRKLFPLKTTSEKLVDNSGNGFDALYGVRNLRFVFPGVLFRGGANNTTHHNSPRPNMNPLQDDGLKHLCEQGFEEAVYLYNTNFSSAPGFVNCKSAVGSATPTARRLRYRSLDPFVTADQVAIFQTLLDSARDPSHGPVYTHCWNGWHASGFISATSLIQFCGVSSDLAVKYWDLNTDGHNDSSYDAIRKKIRAFKPVTGLAFTSEEQRALCPNQNHELDPAQ